MTTDLEQKDEQLAKAAQGGDQAAFTELVQRYEAKMLRYARKFLFGYEDAEDRVQEVFLKAYVNFQSYDSSRPFSPWLYRVAHNEFINAIKKKGKESLPMFDPDTLLPHLVAAETADGDLQQGEMRTMIERCLGMLAPKYREVLILTYMEGMSYKEIAEVTDAPVATIGVRLKRAKEALRTAYVSVNQLN